MFIELKLLQPQFPGKWDVTTFLLVFIEIHFMYRILATT